MNGPTLWAFLGAQTLYVGLAVVSIIRRRNWEQLGYVPVTMIAFIVIFFIRGSMVDRSVEGSTRMATLAALTAVVCSLGDPTRLMDLEDRDDEEEERSDGFMAVMRRANRYQIALITTIIVGALASEFIDTEWAE